VEDPLFSINAFQVAVAALNFVLLVAMVYSLVRFAQWLKVGRKREKAELAELRDRVASLEARQVEPRAND
jgi:hypothetical protein